MKARVERGYCVSAVPVGYRYEKAGSNGRLLVRNEPLASIVQEALEVYARGAFSSGGSEALPGSTPGISEDSRGIVRNQEVIRLLTRRYMRLCRGAGVGCLASHRPSRAAHQLRDIYEDSVAASPPRLKASACWKRCARRFERQVEQFLDHIADTDVRSIVAVYEKRIRVLEEQEFIISRRIANCDRPLPHFDDALRNALHFLANPCRFWCSERLEVKRAVLKLPFTGKLVYTRD